MPIEIPTGLGAPRRGRQPNPDDLCIMCEVIAGREEKGIVEETELTLTLVNWNQFEWGQVYVIPRRHAPTLLDLTDDEMVEIMRAVRRVADAQIRAYDPEGLNLIQNNGVIAGQEAPHFHMHVVPRRREGSNWGSGPPHIAALEGKEPVKPTRPYRVSLEEEFQIAEEIREWM